MVTSGKKVVPIKEGMWTTPTVPGEQPQLIGSKCPACGEVYFPKKENGICLHCGYRGQLEEYKLSRRGKIHSFSIVLQQPPKYFVGKAPFAYGYIDLPDVRVRAHFTGDFSKLKIGAPVELVIEKLGEDEQGNEVLAPKFKMVTD